MQPDDGKFYGMLIAVVQLLCEDRFRTNGRGQLVNQGDGGGHNSVRRGVILPGERECAGTTVVIGPENEHHVSL